MGFVNWKKKKIFTQDKVSEKKASESPDRGKNWV